MPGTAAPPTASKGLQPFYAGVLQELESLSRRLDALEAARGVQKPRAAAPPAATDAFACDMMVHAVAAGFRSTTLARCPPDYYAHPLDARRRFLGAASTRHLTKSLVLRNTRHSGPHSGGDVSNAEFLCVVVQYGRRLDTDAVARAVDEAREKKGLPRQRRAYRLAAECLRVSGYEPNAVTPLGLATEMPVLVDARIAALVPGTFWLGGGEVSLKWRVEWKEFERIFRPIVAPFSCAEDA